MRSGFKTALSLLTVFLAVWLGLRLLLPLCAPFLLGLGLALIAEPVVGFLSRRLRLPRGVGVAIGVGMTFCFLAIFVLLACAFLVRELGSLAAVVPDLSQTATQGLSRLRAWLMGLVSRTPDGIQPLLGEQVTALFTDGTALVNKVSGYALSLAGSLLTHVPDSALTLGTTIIAGFMISGKLPQLRTWLARKLPREKLKPLLAALGRVRRALAGWLTAQCKLMAMTFMIVALGLTILRIRHALLWALGVALVDAFPVLGTGTVLLPWALVCLLQEDAARAVGLTGVYVAVTLIRSVLEPRLVGQHLGMDPLATLMALYAGYRLWGIGGMLIAPMLAVTAMQLVAPRGT